MRQNDERDEVTHDGRCQGACAECDAGAVDFCRNDPDSVLILLAESVSGRAVTTVIDATRLVYDALLAKGKPYATA